jgi:hypothetical protein
LTETARKDYTKIDEIFSGGGGGIRTHGTREDTLVFKTNAFDHSATPPLYRSVNRIAQKGKKIKGCHI